MTLDSSIGCPACGQPNREIARYCRTCGAALPGISGQRTRSSAPVIPGQQHYQREPDGPQPPGPQPPGPRPSRRPATIAAGTFAALGLAVLGVWLAGQLTHPSGASRSHVAASAAARVQQSPGPRTSPGGPQRSSPSVSAGPTDRAGSTGPVAVRGPAGVVLAYFAAINAHRYVRAWRLGGDHIGSSYQTFAQGFDTTAHDAVTIESVSGDDVHARLTATQTNGTVKIFSGLYTVYGKAIAYFNVQQVS